MKRVSWSLRRTVALVIAGWIAVLGGLFAYVHSTLRHQQHEAFVELLTARQPTLAAQYVQDVLLALDGRPADPVTSARIMTANLDSMLNGGPVRAAQASRDTETTIAPLRGHAVREKLEAQRRLVGELTSVGNSIVAEGPYAPNVEQHVFGLRILAAQVADSARDAAGLITSQAQASLRRFELIELALAVAGIAAALAMARVLGLSFKRSADRFRALVQGSGDLILVTAADTTITYASPSADTVLGVDAKDLLGQRLHELVHISSVASLAGPHPKTHHPVPVPICIRIRHHDGEWHDYEGTITSLLSMRAVRGLLFNLRDVTDRNLAAVELSVTRDQALEASRTKSMFLATMSHEIRTPMNGVLGLNALLLGTELDEDQREYARGIETAAESLLAILNDILDFSKIEAGRMELDQVDFEPRELLEDLGALLAAGAQRKGVDLVVDVDPRLTGRLRGDPTRLRQILLNLMTNAIKFTSRGEVVLTAEVISDTGSTATVRFSVRDTGIGVSPEDQARLFQPFSQADASTSRHYGGTGLGLAICRQLASLMDGELVLNSAVGKGSTFSFTVSLPVARPAARPTDGRDAELAGRRALVVEESRTRRRALSRILEAWGIEVQTVGGAADAVRCLGNRPAGGGCALDLVVIDHDLPGMDGTELARLIHRLPGLAGVRPVLLTSADGRLAREVVHQLGLAGCLSKPVHRAALRRCLLVAAGLAEDDDADGYVEPGEGRERPVGADVVAEQLHHPARLLVVDDNEMNRFVAVRLLRQLGYTADEAASGREALNAVAGRPYAAVLMDWQMPGMDGLETTRRLRAEEPNGTHVPVIAMTANAFDEDRAACLAAGMDDYVRKPIHTDALGKVLRRWVASGAAGGAAAGEPIADGPTEDEADRVVDHEQLEALGVFEPDGAELLAEMLELYTETTVRAGAGLAAAVHACDTVATAAAAHELAGASANIGAARLAGMLREVEGRARQGDGTTSPGDLATIQAEVAMVLAHLGRLVAQNPRESADADSTVHG